ncbi:hypothetical protein G5B31_12305 [Rhodobacter sp. SGA-6-6]|uniref:hypothetical protein n=1 Tax=Rhodobacter sp. SGA-6-6 TaxID=2710882 RepID=UPI0013ECC890|nr:hypothetical protein [Rhodobacter sp. SGA-6-6]NGM46318.1 hypothetical protein [Rhodobacter sp. SGA-6-6]
MKPIFAAALLALAAAPATAALSGFYDSAEQIGTILGSSEVADALRQAPVDKLEYEGSTADGLLEWEIESRDCELSVYLRAAEPASADGTPATGKTTYGIERIGPCR